MAMTCSPFSSVVSRITRANIAATAPGAAVPEAAVLAFVDAGAPGANAAGVGGTTPAPATDAAPALPCPPAAGGGCCCGLGCGCCAAITIADNGTPTRAVTHIVRTILTRQRNAGISGSAVRGHQM